MRYLGSFGLGAWLLARVQATLWPSWYDDALAKLTDRLLAGSSPGGSTDKPKVGSE